MVDRFIAGRVTRISPEAPVPVVAFEHETQRIGGAANVAHNIAALGGHATLVAVTGMWLLTNDVEGRLPTSAREVSDVTGAGDTVIATMTLALAAGASPAEAARLANEAAGISVSRFGPATVSVDELLKAVSTSAAV